MKAPGRLKFLIITSILGFGISIYQTFHFFETRFGNSSFNTFCNINEAISCTAVDASKYSELLPGIPLSSFAAGWFFAMFIVACIALNPFKRREALRALLGFSLVGSLFSIVYFFIMAFVIQSYCVLCLGIDVLNLIAFGIVLSLKPEGFSTHKPDRKLWKVFSITTTICLAVAVLGTTMINPLAFKSGTIDEIVESTLSKKVETVPLSENDISIGPADAPITIIKYSDFQCPACRNGAYAIHPLMERFKGKIRFIYKNFPLDPACNPGVPTGRGHAFACVAARIALCAQKSGKFEKVYELFFDHQSEFSNERLLELGGEAGLQADTLRACMDEPQTNAALAKTIDEGSVLKIGSTPTFFINGHRVEGTFPTTIWIEVVEKLLAAK